MEEGDVVPSLRGTECPQKEKAQETVGWTEKVSYRRGPGHRAWFSLEDDNKDDRAGQQTLGEFLED